MHSYLLRSVFQRNTIPTSYYTSYLEMSFRGLSMSKARMIFLYKLVLISLKVSVPNRSRPFRYSQRSDSGIILECSYYIIFSYLQISLGPSAFLSFRPPQKVYLYSDYHDSLNSVIQYTELK